MTAMSPLPLPGQPLQQRPIPAGNHDAGVAAGGQFPGNRGAADSVELKLIPVGSRKAGPEQLRQDRQPLAVAGQPLG